MQTSNTNLTWPDEVVQVGAVCDWISSLYPDGPRVTGPIAMYTASVWGIAARFQVATLLAECEVVLKICPLRLYRSAPLVYELLKRTYSPHVPQLIAWTHHKEQSWMLFQPFDGQSVWATKQPANFAEMARVLGEIQQRAAQLTMLEPSLSTTYIEQLPTMFEVVLSKITSTYLAAWESNGHALAKRYGIPDNAIANIDSFRRDIDAWTQELAAGGWPLSLDHVDCHANNAFVQPHAPMVLFDWDESRVSCPFFSLDRMLDSAAELDKEYRRLNEGSKVRGNSTASLVRQAYVDAFPWQTQNRRERAIDLAISLAPIKTCYECMVFADETHWPHMPIVAAWHIGRVLPRWHELRSKPA